MHFVNVKSILSSGNGMNIYRGCSHGCIYCDARSDCYNMSHKFEDIEVKQNAPELLETALRAKRQRCMIGTGAMSDPYLHAEKDLCLTRKCLEIIDKYHFGLSIQTKSDLILRDIDLIDSINRKSKAVVQMTLTTADDTLCRIVEPNVCTTSRRFETLCAFSARNIPVVIWFTPLLPFINDTCENIDGILDYARRAGCRHIMTFGLGLTLRDGDRQYFYQNLDKSFSGLKQRYIDTYGNRYELPIPHHDTLWRHFIEKCNAFGIEYRADEIFRYLYKFEEPAVQETLW